MSLLLVGRQQKHSGETGLFDWHTFSEGEVLGHVYSGSADLFSGGLWVFTLARFQSYYFSLFREKIVEASR